MSRGGAFARILEGNVVMSVILLVGSMEGQQEDCIDSVQLDHRHGQCQKKRARTHLSPPLLVISILESG